MYVRAFLEPLENVFAVGIKPRLIVSKPQAPKSPYQGLGRTIINIHNASRFKDHLRSMKFTILCEKFTEEINYPKNK